MIHNVNINDARTYVLPIANIIGRRLNRIGKLTNKLISLVSKLYTTPDRDDKTEMCNEISAVISEIETLVLKNVDDTQIMEYSLAEFTMKSTMPDKGCPVPVTSEQHAYFA
jgi:hypothetical protein